MKSKIVTIPHVLNIIFFVPKKKIKLRDSYLKRENRGGKIVFVVNERCLIASLGRRASISEVIAEMGGTGEEQTVAD